MNGDGYLASGGKWVCYCANQKGEQIKTGEGVFCLFVQTKSAILVSVESCCTPKYNNIDRIYCENPIGQSWPLSNAEQHQSSEPREHEYQPTFAVTYLRLQVGHLVLQVAHPVRVVQVRAQLTLGQHLRVLQRSDQIQSSVFFKPKTIEDTQYLINS